MKNLSLILSILALVGVAVLYIIYFSADTSKANSNINLDNFNDTIPTSLSNFNVAYVNIDSVFANYTLYAELEELLVQKQKTAENQISYRSAALEQKMVDYQEKIAKQLITRRQAEETEQQLVTERDNLMALNEKYTRELMESESQMNRTLYDSIYSFLNSYARQHNYDYVIKNSYGGTLLYAVEAMNITNDVIEGLNKRYGSSPSQAQ